MTSDPMTSDLADAMNDNAKSNDVMKLMTSDLIDATSDNAKTNDAMKLMTSDLIDTLKLNLVLGGPERPNATPTTSDLMKIEATLQP